MNNYNNRSMTSQDPRYMQRDRMSAVVKPVSPKEAQEAIEPLKNQVGDALKNDKEAMKSLQHQIRP
jgi:hypothetical protein